MAYIDFLSVVHKSTKRDYLARVNDPDFPKAVAAERAKKWDFDYWDGDRRINYGGYKYMPGRWEKVAKAIGRPTTASSRATRSLMWAVARVFCCIDFTLVVPGVEIYGIDISQYAIDNAKEEVRDRLTVGNATKLPWPDQHFDLVYSLNTLHNLHCYDLDPALREIERVGKKNKYVCVESYRNEVEKANLLYWQVTCEAFNTPEEWAWWFKQTGYTGDHSFIYFE